MSCSHSERSELPYEVWVEILRYLDVKSLWHTTRPVSKLLHHISSQYLKTALVEGGICQLRHYVSPNDDLLHERLEYTREPSDYHRRLLEQEGDSSLNHLLLWTSPKPTCVDISPVNAAAMTTVKFIFPDGKKYYTLPTFGRQTSHLNFTNQASLFHCNRKGCRMPQEESVSDGHVCICGCWHAHFLNMERRFTVTIPLAILTAIYLRLSREGQQQSAGSYGAVGDVRRKRVTGNHHSVLVRLLTE
jgi:hypothetical protein